MLDDITLNRQKLKELCEKWLIDEFALFGSVLREDFNKDSDIDVMVAFNASAHWTLIDFVRLKWELEDLLKRNVDVVTRRAIESGRNQLRKNEILGTSRVIYAKAG